MELLLRLGQFSLVFSVHVAGGDAGSAEAGGGGRWKWRVVSGLCVYK